MQTNSGSITIRPGALSSGRMFPGLTNTFSLHHVDNDAGLKAGEVSCRKNKIHHVDGPVLIWDLPQPCCRPGSPFHGNNIPNWPPPLSAG